MEMLYAYTILNNSLAPDNCTPHPATSPEQSFFMFLLAALIFYIWYKNKVDSINMFKD